MNGKQSLLLNEQYYQEIQLIALCKTKLNNTHLSIWEKNLFLFIQQWLDDSPSLLLQTSGSTGKPKSIKVCKQAMRHSARMTGEYFQLKPQQTLLLCLPTTHIAGQMMVVRAFVLGLNLITIQPHDISLPNRAIDFAAMLPLQLYQLLFSGSAKQVNLESIKTLLIGGASVSSKILNKLQQLNINAYQSYAMTETLSHIAIRQLSPQYQKFYTVLDGVQIKQDARNCLLIDAPCLRVHQLVTNDVVKLQSKTQFALLGRFDNVINSGGIKFNPEQLEAKLEAVFPSQRFFISSLDDDRLGQKLILLIEGRPLTLLALKERQKQINQMLTQYQQPKAIYFVDKFIETQTGKIQRQLTLLALKNSSLN